MRFPLTDELLREVETWRLRSACVHCCHYVAETGACGNGWPNREQRRWPLDAPDGAGDRPREAEFCKEFELL